MRDDQMRLSDAERDRAAAELAEHYAQGRLTPEEHAERLDRIWAARTRGELLPVFRDLPGAAVGRPAPRRTPYAVPQRPTGLRSLPSPVLVVLGVLLVLTVVTHLPLIILGLLVWFLLARARHGHYPRRW